MFTKRHFVQIGAFILASSLLLVTVFVNQMQLRHQSNAGYIPGGITDDLPDLALTAAACPPKGATTFKCNVDIDTDAPSIYAPIIKKVDSMLSPTQSGSGYTNPCYDAYIAQLPTNPVAATSFPTWSKTVGIYACTVTVTKVETKTGSNCRQLYDTDSCFGIITNLNSVATLPGDTITDTLSGPTSDGVVQNNSTVAVPIVGTAVITGQAEAFRFLKNGTWGAYNSNLAGSNDISNEFGTGVKLHFDAPVEYLTEGVSRVY